MGYSPSIFFSLAFYYIAGLWCQVEMEYDIIISLLILIYQKPQSYPELICGMCGQLMAFQMDNIQK